MVAFDLTGKTYNNLRVLGIKGKSKSGDVLWHFECVCGKVHYATASNLKNQRVKSCGCLKISGIKKANSTHGKSNEPIYPVWKTMRARCKNKNNKKYPRYGARGIKVCKEWDESFESFYEWAILNGYKDGLTIDRIDNDGDYEPSNCRWVKQKIQQSNKSTNTKIELRGITKTLAEWSRLTGLNHKTITYRLKKGWTAEEALTTSTKNTKVKALQIIERG